MVSTTFTKETHLEIDLPEAVGEAANSETDPLEIIINAAGDYALNGKSLVNNTAATLRSALTELSEGDTSRALIITADANAPHQYVVRAMDSAGQLGFVSMSISTRHPETE